MTFFKPQRPVANQWQSSVRATVLELGDWEYTFHPILQSCVGIPGSGPFFGWVEARSMIYLARRPESLRGVLGVDQPDQKKDSVRGKWRWWRWGWLAIAALGLLQTPSEVIKTVALYQSDHTSGFSIFIGFSIRFAQIYVFAWLWWKTRPVDSKWPTTRLRDKSKAPEEAAPSEFNPGEDE
jgi:hypothetical protein